jgi:RNA polymerase sigma factor (sigma-70 family)
MTTTTPLEQLAARHSAYARYVHQRFFRKLTSQDAEDVAQDAFLAAYESFVVPELDAVQLDLWLKRACHNKALDVLKAREGQGAERRLTPVDIAELVDHLPDWTAEPDRHADDPSADDVAVFRAAFNRLPATEQKILGARHLDNLPVEACARLLGVPRAKYERLHTAAVRRLVNLVVGIRPHDSCLEARTLIDLDHDGLLDHETAARRDAHLEGCLHCRGYQKRSKGIIALLPLPAITLGDRLASKLHALAERFAPFASSADSAATGGAGALGAVGLKVAAVLATGAVAVGGAATAATTHDAHQAEAAHALVRRAGTPAATSAAAVRPASASWSGTYAARSSSSTSSHTTTKAKASTRHRRRRSSSSSSTGELKPLGHEISTGPTATATTASTPRPTNVAPKPTSSPSTTKHAPVAVPTAAPADSTSGEFAPQP